MAHQASVPVKDNALKSLANHSHALGTHWYLTLSKLGRPFDDSHVRFQDASI
jgi:hypothetical protein